MLKEFKERTINPIKKAIYKKLTEILQQTATLSVQDIKKSRKYLFLLHDDKVASAFLNKLMSSVNYEREYVTGFFFKVSLKKHDAVLALTKTIHNPELKTIILSEYIEQIIRPKYVTPNMREFFKALVGIPMKTQILLLMSLLIPTIKTNKNNPLVIMSLLEQLKKVNTPPKVIQALLHELILLNSVSLDLVIIKSKIKTIENFLLLLQRRYNADSRQKMFENMLATMASAIPQFKDNDFDKQILFLGTILTLQEINTLTEILHKTLSADLFIEKAKNPFSPPLQYTHHQSIFAEELYINYPDFLKQKSKTEINIKTAQEKQQYIQSIKTEMLKAKEK